MSIIKVLHLRCSGALLGAENVVLELSSSLSEKHGYQSIVGVLHDTRDPYPEIAEQAKMRNIPVHVFKTNKTIDLTCIRAIKNYIKKENIDIVHTHGYREDIYASLTFTDATKVATNHLWKKSNFTLKLYAFADSIFMMFFKKVIAVSQPILDEMRAIPYLQNKNLSLIANGIDTVRFSPENKSTIRQELNIANDVIVMATVSSLTTEKAHTYLLTALGKRLKIDSNFHLLIIGEGPQRSDIEKQIQQLHLAKHVTLLGKRNDIDKIHIGLDIYILPSLKEGLPMSLLEAMACGTASIATNVGDIASCVIDGDTGMLVEAGNSDAIYGAIDALISSPEKRKNIARAGNQIIGKKFSNEKMIQTHAELYKTLLANN
ncbi:hypothetical protein MNBD_GAMMA05-1251 [hydrothermal vent metagenome]|uniref:Glycosyltransferase n=1 Tax=hydrothermal vent metagenome TaxID=652676 RepID=A0A3B0WRQ9_9ZZZZ